MNKQVKAKYSHKYANKNTQIFIVINLEHILDLKLKSIKSNM